MTQTFRRSNRKKKKKNSCSFGDQNDRSVVSLTIQSIGLTFALRLTAKSRKYFVCPMGLHLRQTQVLVHHQSQAILSNAHV